MIDMMHALGLTDWSSFCWGAGAMFVLVCVTIDLWTWRSANAPTAKDYVVSPSPVIPTPGTGKE